MSKRLGFALAAGSVAALIALPAAATPGKIVVGHPLVGITGGVNEQAGCGSTAPTIDGQWFKVPAKVGDKDTKSVKIVPDSRLDADGYYYDAECSFISEEDDARSYTLAEGALGEVEQGNLPASAAWVIVDGFLGTGSFEITFSGVACSDCDPTPTPSPLPI